MLLLLSLCSWVPIEQFGRNGGSAVVAADQPICLIRVAFYTNPVAFVFEFGLRGYEGRATSLVFVPTMMGPPFSKVKTYWMPFDFIQNEVGWVPTQCNP